MSIKSLRAQGLVFREEIEIQTTLSVCVETIRGRWKMEGEIITEGNTGGQEEEDLKWDTRVRIKVKQDTEDMKLEDERVNSPSRGVCHQNVHR